EGPGADAGEGDGAQRVLDGEGEAVAVAAREQLVLAATAALPDRADGVHDVPGRESVAARDPRLARGAAAERAALGEQLRPRGAVDGAIAPAAAEQRLVGRVHDRVHLLVRDVAHHHLEARQPGRFLEVHRTILLTGAASPPPRDRIGTTR